MVGGHDEFNWEDIPFVNEGGGLILIWDEKYFLKSNCRKGNRWICLEGKLIDKDFLVSILLVYGPNDRSGRATLWDELLALKAGIGSPMLVLGDFNEVLIPQERKGSSSISASITDFKGGSFGTAFVE